MSKEKVQESYIKKLMKEHGDKPSALMDEMLIAITGATYAGSIGETIATRFPDYISEFSDDVTKHKFNLEGFYALIMCHGYTYMDWIENIPDEETKKILDVNLYGSIRLIKQFVNDTINQPYRKKIISIGSMAYKHVLNGSAAYCAAKAGLNHFISCAAWELAPKGFDVYIIHPSNVMDTPMTKVTIESLMRYRGLSQEAAESYWASNSIRKSLLSKEEIANYVEFIIKNDVNYLSGCPIELSGGMR